MKICDFGLARDIMHDSNYISKGSVSILLWDDHSTICLAEPFYILIPSRSETRKLIEQLAAINKIPGAFSAV